MNSGISCRKIEPNLPALVNELVLYCNKRKDDADEKTTENSYFFFLCLALLLFSHLIFFLHSGLGRGLKQNQELVKQIKVQQKRTL